MNFEKLKTGCIVLLSTVLLFFVVLTKVQAENINELQQDKIIVQKLLDANKLAANKKLGLAAVKLSTQEELTKKYLNDLEKKDAEFEKFRKKSALEIRSRDITIAFLKGLIEDGLTDSDGECVKDEKDNCKPVTYSWQDKLSRFKLIDQDIWTKDNEKFFFSQYFKLKGEIFSDKSGKFSVRKIKIQELYDSDIQKPGLQAKEVPDSNIQIVDNDFEYVPLENKKQKYITDIFTFRPLATFDTTLNAGLGFEFLNVERYFDYVNVGLYSKLSTDLDSSLAESITNTRIGFGVNYHLIPPFLPTNFAVGASVSFPFTNLAQPILSIDVMLYLTEDLNPFVSRK